MANQQIYFENLREKVVSALDTAERELLVAVAWITEREIFAALNRAKQRGVSIWVILNDDHINRDSTLNWVQAEQSGMRVFWSNPEWGTMHHKFCVADRSKLLIGSFNWTFKASTQNDESLLIIEEPKIIENCIIQFKSLLKELGGDMDIPEGLTLSSEKIELQLKIRLLEAEISLLEELFTSESGQVEQFTRQIQRSVGPLLIEYNELIARKAALQAERSQSKIDKETAKQAEEQFRQAQSGFQKAKEKEVAMLDEEQKKEIKKMFREASHLAHPDKFMNHPEEEAEATRLMGKLSEAYKLNDYEQVKEIWESLKTGTAFSFTRGDVESLDLIRQLYERLCRKKAALETSVKELQASSEYALWNEYKDKFDELAEKLDNELKLKILILNKELLTSL